jgi:hypothetical protein
MVRLDPLDEDMGQTPSQTEHPHPHQHGFGRDKDEADDRARGKSESLDPDETGDIADEGQAHRG